MVELRWTNDNLFSDYSHTGNTVRPGETIDVDESDVSRYLDHWTDGWERVDSDSDESEDDEDDDTGSDDDEGNLGEDSSTDEETDTEESEPFDPSDYTVAELKDELEDGDYSDGELEALREAEDRSTAVDAINDHLGEE